MRHKAWLVSIYDGVVSACAVVVGVLILLAVLLVTSDVVGRYFFAAPIGWVFEVTEHILVCVPFLGMAWLARRSEHVTIEIVVQALPPAWQGRMDVLASGLCALACAIATWYAFQATVDHYARGIVTYGIYPVPKFLLIAVVTFGLGLTTIEFFRKTVSAATRKRGNG